MVLEIFAFFFCPGQFSLVWIDEEFQLFPPLEGQSCLLLEDRKSSYPSGAAGLYLSDGDQLFLSALTSRHDCTVGGHSDREKQCQGWPLSVGSSRYIYGSLRSIYIAQIYGLCPSWLKSAHSPVQNLYRERNIKAVWPSLKVQEPQLLPGGF